MYLSSIVFHNPVNKIYIKNKTINLSNNPILYLYPLTYKNRPIRIRSNIFRFKMNVPSMYATGINDKTIEIKFCFDTQLNKSK